MFSVNFSTHFIDGTQLLIHEIEIPALCGDKTQEKSSQIPIAYNYYYYYFSHTVNTNCEF